MSTNAGISIKGLKQNNQALIFKLIATGQGLSRADIAKITHLSKMTVGNIVADLIAAQLVVEQESAPDAQPYNGRTPTPLKLSEKAPKIFGVLIKRGLYQIILGDLAGNILDSIIYKIPKPISHSELEQIVLSGIDTLKERNPAAGFAVGVSSIGPVNIREGLILDPPNFYGIQNCPIVKVIAEHTQLPVFLINDGNAGALSESMYGVGKSFSNFLYVHLKYGIGSGLVLRSDLYNGDNGQSGELGHSTINFAGLRCSCGNIGCLEMYANIENVRTYIQQQHALYPATLIKNTETASLVDIINFANQNDSLAVSALNEYCNYLSHSILNVLNALDLSCVILDYESDVPGTIMEDLILRKIQGRISAERFSKLRIVRSGFNGSAPLVGAIAVIADKVFRQQLELVPCAD